jgi:phage terminase large subunit-like protein
VAPPRRRSTNSAPAEPSAAADVLGSTTPRLWTPPLVELTPETSYGYDVVAFADKVLGQPLDEWQQWLCVHLGELRPDGRPRFRTAVVVVARQQGKSHVGRALTLYWLFVEQVGLILGTSTTLSYAKEQWQMCCDTALANEYLRAELGPKPVRSTTGDEVLRTAAGGRYKIAASNRRAGRSLTIDRLIIDELREHSSWDSWSASTNATNARANAQIVCFSNMGDETAVVLNSLRESAMGYLETGSGDDSLGWFEWSAPPGADPTDPHAIAAANPDFGRRTHRDVLLGAARRAKAAGGLQLAGYRTEILCQQVAAIDAAIDSGLWRAAGTEEPLDLGQHKERVALGLDVSLAGDHASLVAAAVVDGQVHLDVVAGWDGAGCTAQVRADLPGLVAKVKPRVVGWLPMGPAAVLTADMAEKKRAGWPPRGVKVEEIRADMAAVCMGLAEQVAAGAIVHADDPMLTQHIDNTQKLPRGDAWVYGRRGSGPVDGAYAAAIAVHLARTIPAPRPPLRAL